MSLCERLAPTHEAKSRETWLPPEQSGEPALQLRYEGGQATAAFALTLTGVERRTDRPLESWWPVLEEGQRLEIVYRTEADRLHCLLRGYSQSPTAEIAVTTARGLWRNLDIDLRRGQSAYRFAPSGDPADVAVGSRMTAPPRWLVVPQPQRWRMAVVRRSIGYVSTETSSWSGLQVAHPPLQRAMHFNALTALPAYGQSLEIRIVLRPFRWLAAQRTVLQTALREAEILGQVCAVADRQPVTEVKLLEALRQELTVWLQCPQGWRVQYLITAQEPVPSALVDQLCAELLHGRPYQLGRLPTEAAWPNDLDLSNVIIAKANGLPPLLPTPRRLLKQGTPLHYGYAPPLLPVEGVVLGQTRGGHQPRPVHFTPSDRARHCSVLGATGTGKSTLLYNLLAQDIAAGAGVCLIDPHGDLYQQVLAAVPPHRCKDVILIEPGHPDRAVGINFLECTGPHPQVRMNFITNELIRIFDRLYDLHLTGGPVFEQYMRNALLLVMDNEIMDGTLMDIPWLFENANYRKHLLKYCRNEYTVSFWRDQAEKAGGEISLSNMGPYITSKLNQFTSNALLRPIIGQGHNTVDFRACMDEGRIVLVHLPKGLLGHMDTQLLGMLIIGKFFDAALQRYTTPEAQRRPFHLYIDEAHHFTTSSVVNLLAEARKYGLYLTLANQNLTQLGHGLMDAILGNVGSLLLFRLGVRDAEQMAAYVKPELRERDLQDLPDRQVVARMLMLGAPSRPFVFSTQPPYSPPDYSPAEREQAQAELTWSRLHYTRSIQEVENALFERRRLSLG